MRIVLTVFYDPQDLGCRYLAKFLKMHGHEIRIVALKTAFRGRLSALPTPQDVAKKCHRVSGAWAGLSFLEQNEISDTELELFSQAIAEWQPDVVGFGTRSKNFVHLSRIIPAIRIGAPDAFLVAGGFGPSLEPEIPLQLGVDAVIRGEGEYALLELVECLATKSSWKQIAGIAYEENGVVVSRPIRKPEKDLDHFPLPFLDPEDIIIINGNDRHELTNIEKNNAELWGTSSYIILTSRGCIAECSYCGGRVLRDLYKAEGVFTPRVRKRSLTNVLEELKIAKQNNPKVIIFIDEFFIHPLDEMLIFFKNYKKHINLPFFAHLSADQIVNHPELLEAAVDAGWYQFVFGLQTGSQEFCKQMYNRNNNNENIIKAVSMCYAQGMSGYCYMILGNILESAEYKNYTLDLIKRFPSFDSSCKQRFFFETSKLTMPYGDVPIKKNFPELMQTSFSSALFYYDAMMLEFRLLYNDAEFTALTQNPLYHEQPHLLGQLYQQKIQAAHADYFSRELQRLHGKKVFVWGAGEAFKKNRKLLQHINICALLVDIPGAPKELDGIPVEHPDTALPNANEPVIIMARQAHANTIYKKIIRSYPHIKDIVCCVLFAC